MQKLTGIPTTYAGVEFRSRLEAKWAAFFDLVGWKWTYEPLDYPGWIPDFMLAGVPRGILVEVKPEHQWPATEAELGAIVTPHEILLIGEAPFLRRGAEGGDLLGRICDRYTEDATSGLWQGAEFGRSGTGAFGFGADFNSFHDRISGIHNGTSSIVPDTDRAIELWRKAGNTTKWQSERWQDRCGWRG
jgi:hypothetical protein